MRVNVFLVGVCAACTPASSSKLDRVEGWQDSAVDSAVDSGGVVDSGEPADVLTEPPCNTHLSLDAGAVRTSTAVMQGVRHDGGTRVLGIPFAEAPVDARRFAAPEPYACRPDEALDGADWPSKCLQRDPDTDRSIGAEDCLFLNVFTPEALPLDAPSAHRPVLVFIHGGGHVAGSTSEELVVREHLYDGAELAAATGAVVVTLQYRLGALGFLTHPDLLDAAGHTGNWGLLDQQLALQWVQENAPSFGGNPDQVMLFGESAGAVDTCMQLVSPGAAGLFGAAAVQSGSCPTRTLAEARDEAEAAFETVGCTHTESRLDCLRSEVDPEAFSALSQAILSGIGIPGGGGWGPVVDGVVLPDAPRALIEAGAHNAVPTILGTNAHETAQWVPELTERQVETLLRGYFDDLAPDIQALYPVSAYDSARWAWVDLTTDSVFTCRSRGFADLLAAHQAPPVYRYFFSKRPVGASGEQDGAWHGVELLYLFQTTQRLVDLGVYAPDDADWRVQEVMARAWSNLASTGVPDDGPLDLGLDWPAVGAADHDVLELGATTGVVAAPRSAYCAFWEPHIEVP